MEESIAATAKGADEKRSTMTPRLVFEDETCMSYATKVAKEKRVTMMPRLAVTMMPRLRCSFGAHMTYYVGVP